MVYTKKNCSNCGYNIQPLKKDNNDFEIDIPYVICPRCGTYLIDKQKQEYIMFTWFSYVRYFGWMPLYGAAIGLLIGVVIALAFDKIISVEVPDLTFAICSIVMAIVFLLVRYRDFKVEKVLSLERTKDRSYLRELLRLNLISNDCYKAILNNDEEIKKQIMPKKSFGGVKMYRFCPDCGNEIAAGERFCSKCGLDLKADEDTIKPKNAMDQLLREQAKEIIKTMEANEVEQPNNEADKDFGLVPDKPIFTLAIELVDGQKAYLDKLYTTKGEKITWERRCSMSAEGINGLVDAYDTFLPSGEQYKTIYINMYGARVSQTAPAGFTFQEKASTVLDSCVPKTECPQDIIQDKEIIRKKKNVKGIIPWILCAILIVAVFIVLDENNNLQTEIEELKEKPKNYTLVQDNEEYLEYWENNHEKVDFIDEHVVFVIDGYGDYYYTYDEMIELTEDGEFEFWAYNEELAKSEGYVKGSL